MPRDLGQDESRPADDLPDWARHRKQPRDQSTGFLRPRRCELYRAGHTVHYIQAHHSAGEPHRSGELLRVNDNVITIDFGDEVIGYRNHEPERLREIVGLGGRVQVCEGFVILRAGTSNISGYYFSIARADWPWIPCAQKPLTTAIPEALADRLRTHGGFLLPR